MPDFFSSGRFRQSVPQVVFGCRPKGWKEQVSDVLCDSDLNDLNKDTLRTVAIRSPRKSPHSALKMMRQYKSKLLKTNWLLR